jgi:hypothetical protein
LGDAVWNPHENLKATWHFSPVNGSDASAAPGLSHPTGPGVTKPLLNC